MFFRNANLLSLTDRNVTTGSDAFTADGVGSVYGLTSGNTCKNIRSVTVNGVSQTNYTQYVHNYNTGSLMIKTVPGNSSGVVITYDRGPDKMFGEYPRIDLSTSSYPRFSLEVEDQPSRPGAFGGDVLETDYLVTASLFANDVEDINGVLSNAKAMILKSGTSFFYSNEVQVKGMSGPIIDPSRHESITGKALNLFVPFVIEDTS